MVGASHEDEEDIVFDEDYEDGDLEVDDVRDGGGGRMEDAYMMGEAFLEPITLACDARQD